MQQFTAPLPVAAVLFAFWVLLSGKFDAAHLGAGAVAALVIAAATEKLWALPPAIGVSATRPFAGMRWGRGLIYLPWLAWAVVASAFDVAYIVLHPRMPIDPRLVRFRSRLPHTMARLTLANSITLTPGTVTLDVEGDDFLVHALTPAAAREIEIGGMRDRVARLFEPGHPQPPAGHQP